jgi:ABC-type phosphate/phosphonate transport system ATPase subunit
MLDLGLQSHQGLMKKTMQLYETKLTRHGVMVVGKSGAGKSTCWKVLQRALSRLKRVRPLFLFLTFIAIIIIN